MFLTIFSPLLLHHCHALIAGKAAGGSSKLYELVLNGMLERPVNNLICLVDIISILLIIDLTRI